jgi:hypothetical protein
MEKGKLLMLAGLVTLVVLFVPVVFGSWATICNVTTTDSASNPKTDFNPGDTVYVHWTANGNINITVYYETAPNTYIKDGESWTNQASSGVVSFVPQHGAGYYEINCTGAAAKNIAVSSIQVVPEFIFGTIAAVGAAFAAFGIFKIRNKRARKK